MPSPRLTPMPRGSRARTATAKADRRSIILAAALQLSRTVPFAELTMASIAAHVGLTKGTLYLYFPTKEQLFLALLATEMRDWYDAVDTALMAPNPRVVSEVSAILADAFLARPDLTRLLALLESVLERNIDLDTAIAFKQSILTRTLRTAELLESAVPALPAGSGVGVLLRSRALLVGLQVMADPSPVVRAAFEATPHLAPFQIDFAREVRVGITALLAGALNTSNS